MTTTCADILELWWDLHRSRPCDHATEFRKVNEVRLALVDMGRNVHGRARSLLDDLSNGLGADREAALWWAVLCGWPHGFPPDPSLTPAAELHANFDPMTGEPIKTTGGV